MYNINAAHAFCTKLSELHLRIQAFNQNNKQKSKHFKLNKIIKLSHFVLFYFINRLHKRQLIVTYMAKYIIKE